MPPDIADTDRVAISVVYARPDRQSLVELTVAPHTTVAQAIALSGLRQRFPEIASLPGAYAIYSRIVPESHVVQSGDRIEILQPLLTDPKEARRQAAARGREPKAAIR